MEDVKRILLALLCYSAFAADFQPAKVINISPFTEARPPIIAPNGNNPVLIPVAPWQLFTVTVQIGDLGYSANYALGKHLDPSKWIVGDSISIRLDGDNLVVKDDRGKELKSRILRRERMAQKETPQ